MNKKSLPIRLLEYIYHYNVFILDDDDNDKVRDPALTLKHQLYTTRLYIPLLIMIYFRTTVKSQFELLADFCSICQKTVFESLTDLKNEQLVTVQLLSDDQVRSQILANIDLIKSSVPAQIESIVKLLQITTQTNSLISALNTNAHVVTGLSYAQIPYIDPYSTQFYNENSSYQLNFFAQTCSIVSGIAFAGFYSLSPYDTSSKFVLSSSGNKMDCYRIWEALYPGPTPIIINKRINSIFQQLPVLIINNYEDLTLQLLKDFYNTTIHQKYDY
ncbi:unnamed protein product [Adineta steineri]|uniref:Uncharacterized protein n=2 Tax=Adineta steineri TaxID=433720 RepID=A0A819T894_9BILA|nr:unnamed protein product [Adineta steineri]